MTKTHFAAVEEGQDESKTACGISITKGDNSSGWHNTKSTWRIDINENGEDKGRYSRIDCASCQNKLDSTPEAKAKKAAQDYRMEMGRIKYQAKQQMQQAVDEIEKAALDTSIPAERMHQLTDECLAKIASASQALRNAHIQHVQALLS